MDVGFAARVVVVATAVVLAFAIVAFGPASAPHARLRRLRRARRASRAYGARGRRLASANVMSYVAASMAVALGSAVAVTH
ncbi:MAG TPA: hypothetical protein VN738_10630 [Acidothermaceae bacterium]|jgi:hypothetical protein|nr:hypothetical protein [Acidothermaceae bacterium]